MELQAGPTRPRLFFCPAHAPMGLVQPANSALTATGPGANAAPGIVDTSRHDAGARPQGARMNRDIIAGNWKQLKGQMKAKWGDLTDDVFDEAEGNTEYLAGKLQAQYEIGRASCRGRVWSAVGER